MAVITGYYRTVAATVALAAVPWSVEGGDQDPNTWWDFGRWRVGVVSRGIVLVRDVGVAQRLFWLCHDH